MVCEPDQNSRSPPARAAASPPAEAQQPERRRPKLADARAHFPDGPGIPHDAPLCNIFPARFKLWLDQGHQRPPRPQQGHAAGSTFVSEMNETSIVTRSSGSPTTAASGTGR